jgi:uncharacterized protein with HEPN domain
LRDKVIHEYFRVDWELLWRVVEDDLDPLEATIAAELARERDPIEPD